MTATINTMLPGLITSDGCQTVFPLLVDASIDEIYDIPKRSCQNIYLPKVKLRNRGSSLLNSVEIIYTIDDSSVNSYTWTGSLGIFDTILVSLPLFSISPGLHNFKAYSKDPNLSSDLNSLNDTLSFDFFNYSSALSLPYSEGFEGDVFPPANCTIINTELGYTFQREDSVLAKGCVGNYCLRLDNKTCANSFGYQGMYCWKPLDEFILPNLNLSFTEMPLLTFRYAYSNHKFFSGSPHFTDTLEVLISTDCGVTYTSLYLKNDSLLCTCYPLNSSNPVYFPSSINQWRKDTINLLVYKNYDNVLLKFRVYGFSLGYGNNIFIDDINIANTVGIKEIDLLNDISIYPNPTNELVSIDSPISELKIEIHDVLGKLINLGIVKLAYNKWQIDFHGIETGVYFLRLSTQDDFVIKKVIFVK